MYQFVPFAFSCCFWYSWDHCQDHRCLPLTSGLHPFLDLHLSSGFPAVIIVRDIWSKNYYNMHLINRHMGINPLRKYIQCLNPLTNNLSAPTTSSLLGFHRSSWQTILMTLDPSVVNYKIPQLWKENTECRFMHYLLFTLLNALLSLQRLPDTNITSYISEYVYSKNAYIDRMRHSISFTKTIVL